MNNDSKKDSLQRLASHQKLGDLKLSKKKFNNLEKIFDDFSAPEFTQLNERQKIHFVSSALLDCIKAAEEPSFLLIPTLAYIEEVIQKGVLESYNFSIFELWLNQFSGLSSEENYRVRAKIVGKFIPRDEYQSLFPVGMGKVYPGSHYVTAHGSPDLDTTVASFWGWIDAFGSRVSEGLHLWNVPEGSSASEVEKDLLFYQVFGKDVFHNLSKSKSTLSLTSADLMTQKGVVKKNLQENAFSADHERQEHAVFIVDEKGYYKGDWRLTDVEGVHQVINLLNSALRWFENNLHVHFVSLFAKAHLSSNEVTQFVDSILNSKIETCDPVADFTVKQRKHVNDYLVKVLGVTEGLSGTIKDLAIGLQKYEIFDFKDFIDILYSLKDSPLFDKKGQLIENRTVIFEQLEKIIKGLDRAIYHLRLYVERLEVSLRVKTEVFGYTPKCVSYKADIEEIKSKIESYPYLTVVYADKEGRLIPMGVVQASDLYKTVLGTVTLRDFCNRDETKVPSYLEVISAIDHHKSSLHTSSPATVTLADSQSANALVAERAFEINDKFSTGGMTSQEIETQVSTAHKELSSHSSRRVLARLLAKLSASKLEEYYVAPEREILEYLHFLYAIMDDTDLLTKISYRDIMTVGSLLNRLKSLAIGKEVEIISFDDLKKDETFIKKAAKRIVQNEDMYSLYKKIYSSKEKSVDENIEACSKGDTGSFFVDTKLQNGCSRVGQTKIFSNNYELFSKHRKQIRDIWLNEAKEYYKNHKDYDFHLHMISTISGAEELFKGTEGSYTHKDELWLWVPPADEGYYHLKSFLDAFKNIPQVVKNDIEVEVIGKNAKELEWIIKENFLPVPCKVNKELTKEDAIVVMHYKAGSLNSRKAVISPCLPKVVA